MSVWHAVLSEVRQQVARTSSNSRAANGLLSDSLEEAASPSQRQATLLWQQQQWHNAFEVLFFQAPATSLQQQDDLLFFVYLEVYQADTPYFVRRKGKTLPAELQTSGEKAHHVDWNQSVLLNLVTQTTYSLTVCACTREHLQSAGSGKPPPQGVVEVSKAVYASTTKSQLNLNNQRANDHNPSVTYPDISFAVENFEEAFESLMLTSPSQCYLVLLTASAGMTFTANQSLSPGSTGHTQAVPAQPSALPPDSVQKLAPTAPASRQDRAKQRGLTVFSGFVSYEQLEQKLLGGQKKGLRWLSKNVEGPHPVRMRGPGGQGFADVAVTCLTQAATDGQQSNAPRAPPLSPNLTWQELQGPSQSPGSSHEQKRTGILGSALGAAANVLKAIGNSDKGAQAPDQIVVHDMRCALMNLSLPMEPLAQQLLQ